MFQSFLVIVRGIQCNETMQWANEIMFKIKTSSHCKQYRKQKPYSNQIENISSILPLFKSIQYIQFINLEPHVGHDKLTTHSFVMKVMLLTKITSQLASHNNPTTNAKFQKRRTSKLRFQPGLARSRFCIRDGSKNQIEESNLELNQTGYRRQTHLRT